MVADPDRIEPERLGVRRDRPEKLRAVGNLDAEPDAALRHLMSSFTGASERCDGQGDGADEPKGAPGAHRGKASRTPPSTVSVQPVVLPARSEARNSTASATSSGRTETPSRLRFR